MFDQSLVDLFLKGGIVMWPLLVCSIFAMALILERSVVFLLGATRFPELVQRLEKQVRSGQIAQAREELDRSRSPVARVAAVYLKQLQNSKVVREEIVTREAAQELAHEAPPHPRGLARSLGRQPHHHDLRRQDLSVPTDVDQP